MSNVSVVSAPESKVVHLALLWNCTPLCGRDRDSEWTEVDWEGVDEKRRLCKYCSDLLEQFNTRARMYPFQRGGAA